jgi:heterodisulfide reductase subunit A-like polyferredoxin
VLSEERDASRARHPRGCDKGRLPEIQEAEENSGVALLQCVGSGEAHVLELACAPWADAFEAGDDTEDDEEATV